MPADPIKRWQWQKCAECGKSRASWAHAFNRPSAFAHSFVPKPEDACPRCKGAGDWAHPHSRSYSVCGECKGSGIARTPTGGTAE